MSIPFWFSGCVKHTTDWRAGMKHPPSVDLWYSPHKFISPLVWNEYTILVQWECEAYYWLTCGDETPTVSRLSVQPAQISERQNVLGCSVVFCGFALPVVRAIAISPHRNFAPSQFRPASSSQGSVRPAFIPWSPWRSSFSRRPIGQFPELALLVPYCHCKSKAKIKISNTFKSEHVTLLLKRLLVSVFKWTPVVLSVSVLFKSSWCFLKKKTFVLKSKLL